MLKKIKVLLADDHVCLSSGLQSLLEKESDIAIVGVATTGEQAVKLAQQKLPNVVLMDINMPGMGGFEATRHIVRTLPDTYIIILSSYDASPYPDQFIKIGAKGFLSKNTDINQILKAIRTVAQNKAYIDPDIAQKLAFDNIKKQKSGLDTEKALLETLSRREMQVFFLISSGMSVKEIATGLCVSLKDVNSHRYKIFKKLGLKTDVQLSHFAMRHKLIQC